MNLLKLSILRTGVRFKNTGVVLFGHNVSEHTGDKLIPSLHLKPEELEYNIKLFKQVGFEFISTNRLTQISEQRFRSNKPWVHLTFDDGYQENLDVILPILIKHQVPATIFISSHHIENNERFYTYRMKQAILHTSDSFTHNGITLKQDDGLEERLRFYRTAIEDFKLMTSEEALNFMTEIDKLLTPEQKQDLDNEGWCDKVLDMDSLLELAGHELITIGSHNHHHLIMNANLSADEIEYQMSTSKQWIREKLRIDCTTYCYPNGQNNDFTELSKKICSKHYQTAFTTLSGFVDKSTNPYEIPRMFLLGDCISIVNRFAFPEWVFKLKHSISSIGK